MSTQIEIRHLECFLELSETLHYRKAAEKLYISQSALTQQIQKLESILGDKLFIRSNREVQLSHSGQLFKIEAQLIVNRISKSLERWELAKKGNQGLLYLGYVASAMEEYLPDILKKFAARYPNIHFHLYENSNEQQLKSLESNLLDIAFMRSNDISASMNIASVYKEPFTIALPKDHNISSQNFRHIGQLSDEDYILFPNSQSQMYYQQILSICADQKFSPNIVHQSIHFPTIFKLVENGMGITIIPKSSKDVHNKNIKYIDLDQVHQRTELFAVWKKENENPALENLLEVLDLKANL